MALPRDHDGASCVREGAPKAPPSQSFARNDASSMTSGAVRASRGASLLQQGAIELSRSAVMGERWRLIEAQKRHLVDQGVILRLRPPFLQPTDRSIGPKRRHLRNVDAPAASRGHVLGDRKAPSRAQRAPRSLHARVYGRSGRGICTERVVRRLARRPRCGEGPPAGHRRLDMAGETWAFIADGSNGGRVTRAVHDSRRG